MKFLALASLKVFVLSFCISAFAGQSGGATCSYESQPLNCAVSATEKYCFAKVSCDDGVEGTAVCAPVNGRCPAVENCMEDPTDADATMERLGSHRGVNPAGCSAFAIAPAPKPPGGRMGGAAGPGR